MSSFNKLLFVNPHRSTEIPQQMEVDGVAVSYGTGDGEVVIDIGCLFSEQSRKFPAEKRGLVIVEPQGGRDVLAAICRGHAPQEVCGDLNKKVADYYGFAIYWWNERLSHLPQFRKFLWGFSFLSEDQFGLRDKKFGVGGVVSPRQSAAFPGYSIRHEILDRENEINIPGVIYNYRRVWKGTAHGYPIPTKSPAFDWTHHLAIENCQEDGYFSEKLLDCFLSYTVPIYYGDPTITSIFDINGMIIVQSADEILEVLANLTEDDYLKRMGALDRNFQLAKQYIIPDEMLVRMVVDECQRKS